MSGAAFIRVAGVQPDLAVAAMPDDERVWVPQRPMCGLGSDYVDAFDR